MRGDRSRHPSEIEVEGGGSRLLVGLRESESEVESVLYRATGHAGEETSFGSQFGRLKAPAANLDCWSEYPLLCDPWSVQQPASAARGEGTISAELWPSFGSVKLHTASGRGAYISIAVPS